MRAAATKSNPFSYPRPTSPPPPVGHVGPWNRASSAMLGKDKKKREFALFFFRARSFRFFSRFFFFALSRFFFSFALASAKARKRESAKKARVPSSALLTFSPSAPLRHACSPMESVLSPPPLLQFVQFPYCSCSITSSPPLLMQFHFPLCFCHHLTIAIGEVTSLQSVLSPPNYVLHLVQPPPSIILLPPHYCTASYAVT
jgi:hypothetical protein